MSTPPTPLQNRHTEITYEKFIVSFLYIIELINDIFDERNDFILKVCKELALMILRSAFKLQPRLYEIIFKEPIEHFLAGEYNLKIDRDQKRNENEIRQGLEREQRNSFESAGPSTRRSTVHPIEDIARRQSFAPKPKPPSLFTLMKNNIGKDLSKIPMPVHFNEPLTMLQRLAEDYEYSYLLDTAAQCSDICEQLAYIAAFIISSFSTTVDRVNKPFNPLLGETYECDRRNDLGWCYLAEQVSHHPPISALRCEGKSWKCSEDFMMSSKFWGKYLQITPLGKSILEFGESNNCFVWHGVTTIVHNIVIGKLWIDHDGDMTITGLKNAEGNSCQLTFMPYSYFDHHNQRRVKGTVSNNLNEVKWIINGTWDSTVEIGPVLSTIKSKHHIEYQTGDLKTVWKRVLPPPENEKLYNFTKLASELNAHEVDIPPTDSRLRPDQRLMEQGKWDESNQEKIRLEDKQRSSKYLQELAIISGIEIPIYKPLWFTKVSNGENNELIYQFNGDYWLKKDLQDWSACPDIF